MIEQNSIEMKNIFEQSVTDEIIKRIHALSPNQQAKWGKMDAGQMMAHCNVSYEMAFNPNYPKPNILMRWILKTMVKKKVVGEVPYSKNIPTAPQFVMKEAKDFEKEKKQLIQYLHRTQEMGSKAFEGKESPSFGRLTSQEWNNLLFKHIDHHLTQFGV